MGRNFYDLQNKKFGKLTVIKRSERSDKRGMIYWDCICECGNSKTLRSDVLRKTGVKDCGCNGNRIRIGDKFGKLKVVARAEKKRRTLFWKCKCDCGSKKELEL